MTQTLVTIAEYRSITSDTATSSTTVSACLENALSLIDEYLERTLQSATYTETLEVWYEDGIGYVYPINTPITSIPLGSPYDIDYGERRLRGVIADSPAGVSWPTFSFGPWSQNSAISPYSRNRPDYATVTYTGGYTNATIPYTLKTYIALCAKGVAFRSAATVIGATSVSVGDVSVTYPKMTGGLDALVPGMSMGLRPYKRKRIRF